MTRQINYETIANDDKLLDFIFELICDYEVAKINIQDCPLITMAFKNQIEKFERYTGYDLIVKWVNYLLQGKKEVNYLDRDFVNGRAYINIVKTIDSKFNSDILSGSVAPQELVAAALKYIEGTYKFPSIFTPDCLVMRSKFMYSLFLSMFIQIRVETALKHLEMW